MSLVENQRYDYILVLPGLDGGFMKKAGEVPARMIQYLSEDDQFSRQFPDVKNRALILPESPFYAKGNRFLALLKHLKLYKASANPGSKLVNRVTRQVETLIRERESAEPLRKKHVLAVGVSAGGQLAASIAAHNPKNPMFSIDRIVTFGTPFVKGVLGRVPEGVPVDIHNASRDSVVRMTKTFGLLGGFIPDKLPKKPAFSIFEHIHPLAKSYHTNMFSYRNPEFKEKVFLPAMRDTVAPVVHQVFLDKMLKNLRKWENNYTMPV
jgi:pimeloyl-ACP methyl ester carboxylesterase